MNIFYGIIFNLANIALVIIALYLHDKTEYMGYIANCIQLVGIIILFDKWGGEC